jgi:myosin-5
LPIYTAEILEEFLNKPDKMKDSHIFAIAGQAFKAATTGQLDGIPVSSPNQAFVISGESGAGKTESTKLILQYLSEASGGSKRGSGGINNYILSVNPMLEAFGNAKTVRNDNSSRFGKWMEIHFKKEGALKPKMIGGVIINYLLEKSRVITVGKGERGYHIFYQLCAACSRDPTMNNRYELEHPSAFNFLNKSDVYTIPHPDEAGFDETVKAMELIQFSKVEIESVFAIVAAILHLGNVNIRGKESDAGVQALIENEPQLERAAKILGVSMESLKKVLITKEFGVGDIAFINLRPEEAVAMRNSLCTGLYAKLFDWLVSKANKQLAASAEESKQEKDLYIGVLDIFGFEIFEVNSFEQFW